MSKIFNITDYGAKPDGTIQTNNIQKALDACFLAGGGKVVVPQGEFITGGVRVRSNTTLYLESGAILKGTRNPEDYFAWKNDELEPVNPEKLTDDLWVNVRDRKSSDFLKLAGSRWNNAIIRVIDAENVAIIGEEGSVIDGSDCYDEIGEENYRGPHGINIRESKNITLKGYRIQNTGNWANTIFFTQNIHVDDVTVWGGHDGIHMQGCDDILIENCGIYSGDDCIAGYDNHDVHVRNCEVNSACSAFRFGGNNVLIEDCHVFGPAKVLFRGGLSLQEKIDGAHVSMTGRYNMLSVFTYYSDFNFNVRKTPENIVVRNCKVENTTRFLHYNFSGNENWQLNRPLEQIKFENITVDGVDMPFHAYGSADAPATVELKNITYKVNPEAKFNELFKIANLKELKLENVTVSDFNGDMVFASWGNVEKIELNNFSLGSNADELTVLREDEFVCGAI